MAKRAFFILLILSALSCAGPRYTFTYDAGKELDFSQGKWLLNDTRSNSTVFDAELYERTLKEFRKILGDSLFTLKDVRRNQLVPATLAFELSDPELRELGGQSSCRYLINVSGHIITENAGSLSIPSDDPHYYATNESAVRIKIYDLHSGMLISSSEAYAKLVDQGSHFEESKGIPMLLQSSHASMLVAAEKLIRKYRKNRVDG